MQRKPHRLPPGPKGLPLVGNLLDVPERFQWKTYDEWSRKYGAYRARNPAFCINPTSGVLMAILATSGISYGKWLRFMIPLTVIWAVLATIFLTIGVLIKWGPF